MTAIPLLTFAEALWEQLGVQGRQIAVKKQAALFALGEERFTSMWQEGQKIDVNLAIENEILQ